MAGFYRLLQNLAFEVASALGLDRSAAFQVSTLRVASHSEDVEVELLEPGGEHFSVNLIHFFEGKTLVKLNHVAELWQLGRDALHFEVVAFLSIRLSFDSGRLQ